MQRSEVSPMQAPWSLVQSVSIYEPRFVSFVGFLVVPLTLLGPKFLLLLCRIPQAAHNVCLCVYASVSISCW